MTLTTVKGYLYNHVKLRENWQLKYHHFTAIINAYFIQKTNKARPIKLSIIRQNEDSDQSHSFYFPPQINFEIKETLLFKVYKTCLGFSGTEIFTSLKKMLSWVEKLVTDRSISSPLIAIEKKNKVWPGAICIVP